MTEDEVFKVLVALGDVHRFEIVRRLMNKPETPAGALIEGRAPSTISHHLKILGGAGLVRSERRGRQILYSLRSETMSALGGWAHHSAETPVFSRLSHAYLRPPG